ncbi:MAG: hypothetical protein MHM6MM_000358 [Cercozoa sp. M6MM]
MHGARRRAAHYAEEWIVVNTNQTQYAVSTASDEGFIAPADDVAELWDRMNEEQRRALSKVASTEAAFDFARSLGIQTFPLQVEDDPLRPVLTIGEVSDAEVDASSDSDSEGQGTRAREPEIVQTEGQWTLSNFLSRMHENVSLWWQDLFLPNVSHHEEEPHAQFDTSSATEAPMTAENVAWATRVTLEKLVKQARTALNDPKISAPTIVALTVTLCVARNPAVFAAVGATSAAMAAADMYHRRKDSSDMPPTQEPK